MKPRRVRILGTGAYLPQSRVTPAELNRLLGKEAGWVERFYGIETRHYAGTETTSHMAVQAALAALHNSNCAASELDCIISGCSVMEQAIPTTSVPIQEQLGLAESGIPAFDVNSTCMSFLTALDLATHLIEGGSYQRILIVSSEMPSLGLDWSDAETSAIFGDGAGAVVLARAESDSDSCCLGSLMQTFSSGAHYCEVAGAGTRVHAMPAAERPADANLFRMDGQAAYRLTAEKLPILIDTLLQRLNLTLEDIALLVPHQASAPAIRHMIRRMRLSPAQVVDICASHGNQVAASIPSALNHAVSGGLLKRGDLVMLIGTAAGISLGAMVLRY